MAVHLQQHGGRIGSGDLESVNGEEVVVIAGVHVAVEYEIAVGLHAYVGRSAGGDGEVEGGFGGRSGGRVGSSGSGWGRGGLSPASAVVTPAVKAPGIESGEKNESAENEDDGNPAGHGRDAVFGVGESGGHMGVVGEVIFGEEGFFVEAEITRDGTDKTAVEDAAGESFPIFVFEGVEEARANTSG